VRFLGERGGAQGERFRKRVSAGKKPLEKGIAERGFARGGEGGGGRWGEITNGAFGGYGKGGGGSRYY